MFKAVLADPKLLKSSIDAISNMIDEAGVSVDEKGIRLRAMDPAHVALVDFELKKEAFDEFEFGESIAELQEILHGKEVELRKKKVPEIKDLLKEKGLKLDGKKDELIKRYLETLSDVDKVNEVKGSIVLGLDLDRFNTILKRAGTSDKISLALDEETNSLRIKFENTSTRTFNQPLIGVSEEELKVPNLDFPSIVELSPSIISEAIKDADIISDHVTLKVDSGFLYVLAKGDLGNVEVKVAKDEAVQFEAEKEAQSMFSIEYLKDMVKASDVANSVRILIGDNLPVKMEFLAPSARLSFLLAPRIESD